jgi:hypothetical protein
MPAAPGVLVHPSREEQQTSIEAKPNLPANPVRRSSIDISISLSVNQRSLFE